MTQAEQKVVYDSNYYSVHAWMAKNYGKANKCESNTCTKKSQKYNWAKIKGKAYEKNRDNFMMLCVSCHRKYDMTEQSRKNMSKAKKGIIPVNKGLDNRYKKRCVKCDNEFSTYHETATTCSKTCASLIRQDKIRTGVIKVIYPKRETPYFIINCKGEKYRNVSEASKSTGISRTSIQNNLAGRSNRAGGLICKKEPKTAIQKI